MKPTARICRGCGFLDLLPSGTDREETCVACASRDVEPLTLSGKGKLYSYTRVHVPTRFFETDIPYWFVLVDLDEGHRVMGRLVEKTSTEPAMDARVEVESADERGLQFRLVR